MVWSENYQCRLTHYVLPLNTDVILTRVLCQEIWFCTSKLRQLKGCRNRQSWYQQSQAVPLFYPVLVTKDMFLQRHSPINNSFNVSLSIRPLHKWQRAIFFSDFFWQIIKIKFTIFSVNSLFVSWQIGEK